jgi:hypothetical protein
MEDEKGERGGWVGKEQGCGKRMKVRWETKKQNYGSKKWVTGK